jgi:hypothetical protein
MSRRLSQGLYGSEDQTKTLTFAFCTGPHKSPDLLGVTDNVYRD